MPDITNLVTKTTINAKINEFKGEIPSINNLPTTTALTVFENKIFSVSNLVTKPDYNTKISETEKKISDHSHDKYITTPDLNKLTVENFAARLKQANLVTKIDFDDKLKYVDKKTTSNKRKHIVVENELKS